jgi:hypothetical protein
MNLAQMYGLFAFFVGGSCFAWFAAKLFGKSNAPGTAMAAAFGGIVAVLGLALISNSPAYSGGKTSPAFLGLYWFAAVGLVSYIKTKRTARQQ